MKQVQGIWLPDGDDHFAAMMAKAAPANYRGKLVGVYQHQKLQRAMDYVPHPRGLALDIGAHVGFWSMWLSTLFDQVIAFEPIPEHVECFRRNVDEPNVTLHEVALGDEVVGVRMAVDRANTGKTRVDGLGQTPMDRLDDYMLEGVGFMKIDVEGYEPNVIRGAEATIKTNRPVIIVESNGQNVRYGAPDPVEMLERLGMCVAERLRHDVIMVF